MIPREVRYCYMASNAASSVANELQRGIVGTGAPICEWEMGRFVSDPGLKIYSFLSGRYV